MQQGKIISKARQEKYVRPKDYFLSISDRDRYDDPKDCQRILSDIIEELKRQENKILEAYDKLPDILSGKQIVGLNDRGRQWDHMLCKEIKEKIADFIYILEQEEQVLSEKPDEIELDWDE